MSYSDNFPTQRPIFSLDASNAGRLDPRCSFTRSTTGTYFGTAKHLSSENLVGFSNDISQKTLDGVTATGSQTAPDGGTDAYKLTENSATSDHRFYEIITQPGTAITFSAYFKYIGRQWVNIRLTDGGGADRFVWFDIQNGVAGTAQTGYSNVSISASGNGYYKVSATLGTSGIGGTKYLVIGGASADNSNAFYAGINADAFAVWGIQVSSTGETVLNETTSGRVYRKYAPTLQTAAINAPRFEHSASDSASMGLLVEGSSTNLQRYGNDFGSWNLRSYVTITADAAVAPDGSLTAQSVVPTAISEIHYILDTSISFTSGTTYTSSVFVKSAGSRYIQFGGGSSAFGAAAFVNFDLTDGSYTATGMTATASAVGNDWWRLTVTAAATASATEGFYLSYVTSKSAARAGYATGDGYSGYLLYGFQTESGSFASSLVNTGTGSSALTRAAESLSVATADIGYTGGPVTIVSETEGGRGVYPQSFVLTDGTSSNQISVYRNSTAATTTTNWYLSVASDGSNQVLANIPASNTAGKLAVSLNTDDAAFTTVGNSVTTDTSVTIPSGLSQLKIGASWTGGTNHLNGHVKRLAVFGEALSDTNLISLTK